MTRAQNLALASRALAGALRSHGFGAVAKLFRCIESGAAVRVDAMAAAAVLDGQRVFWAAMGNPTRAAECRTWTRVAVLLWRAAATRGVEFPHGFHRALRDAQR